DRGAEIDAKRQDGRTAYQMAVVSGQMEVAKLLQARGADLTLSELEQFVKERVSGETSAQRSGTAMSKVAASDLHSGHLLAQLAETNSIAAVEALLAAGVPVNARGTHGGTALHWACWKGHSDLVKLLLEHGASLTIQDLQFHAPPSGWLHHGAENCSNPDGEY